MHLKTIALAGALAASLLAVNTAHAGWIIGLVDGKSIVTIDPATRKVTGTADIKPEGDGYRLNASFPVRVSEFGIPEPSYLGVGVKDEVVVRVNLNAEPAAVATSGRSK